MFHYIKIPHYRITHNPSHWLMSLIWRHVMSWWDAQGLEEQHGCCGRKSFYFSKYALLNDDDNDNEETFGEYVKSTKQLKKIRRREEMPKRRIPWKWRPRCFSPWYWWIFLWLIFLWLNRHSFMTHSSNSGTMTQLICHPLSPYILSFTRWVKCPPLLSSIFTLITPFPVLHHHFSMAALLCLLRLHIMTHSWLIFDSHYSPCW